MPETDGVQFLTQAREIHPDSRRVLLTAYADTTAAIAAINEVRLHHYPMKPWDPPEQNLYPVLDNLLADWHAEYNPPYRDIRVIGQRWNAEVHRIKDFLGRHQVPFRWVDVEEAAKDLILSQHLKPSGKLPVVVFADHSHEDCPASEILAEKPGLRTKASTQFYELVIGGANRAGLAAMHFSRYARKVTMLVRGVGEGSVVVQFVHQFLAGL